LQCLGWSAEQQEEVIGNGGFIDEANNDLSMNRIQYASGTAKGLRSATDPLDHLSVHQILELEEEEKE